MSSTRHMYQTGSNFIVKSRNGVSFPSDQSHLSAFILSLHVRTCQTRRWSAMLVVLDKTLFAHTQSHAGYCHPSGAIISADLQRNYVCFPSKKRSSILPLPWPLSKQAIVTSTSCLPCL